MAVRVPRWLPVGLLLACRAEKAPPLPMKYDALGLPDCARSFDSIAICDALRPWTSSVPVDFADAGWAAPVTWPGTDVDPYFCTDDPAEAEAWILANTVDPIPYYRMAPGPYWTDLIRTEEDGTTIARIRVLRCDWASFMAPTPPITTSDEPYATLGSPLADSEDLFSAFRQITLRRQDVVTIQVVLAWEEVETETLHAGGCAVRCGICEDYSGGRTRHATGVLERLDWGIDPNTGTVTWSAAALLEADCHTAW